MSNLKFKEATTWDLNESLNMISDFYKAARYPFNRTTAERNFLELITSDHLGKFWLLTFDEETIGYLILTFGYSFEYGGRDAFIDEFYLHERFRGQGLGKRAMEALDVMAGKFSIRAIHLEVEEDNTKGNKLYLESGYKGNRRSLLTKVLIK